jgi:hypothetical protein
MSGAKGRKRRRSETQSDGAANWLTQKSQKASLENVAVTLLRDAVQSDLVDAASATLQEKRRNRASDEEWDTEPIDLALKLENLRSVRLPNDVIEANKNTRRWLIRVLTILSFAWLALTVCMFCCLGFRLGSFCVSDSVMIAFMTTSMFNVLGLWTIGLTYFFK